MRRSMPKTSGLKLVMLFDRRNRPCCVCSHNLDAEEASREVTEMRRDGLQAFTVDQRSRYPCLVKLGWATTGTRSSKSSARGCLIGLPYPQNPSQGREKPP